jgi:hypothetical protein
MTPNPYYAADMDQHWRDEQAALDDWRVDMAKEHGLNRCYQEYCDRYHVSCGICMDGDEFPRCELGRTIRNNGGVR